MARPRRTDEAGVDTRTQVLAAAMRLIATRGHASARLAAVAAEAGVSLGLLQHYFPTRADLFRAAFAAGTDAGLARADAIATASGPAHDRLRRLLAYLCSDGLDPAEGSWAFWLELALAARREPDLDLPVDLAGDAWRALLARVIDDGAQDGTIPSTRAPVEAAADLLALLYGVKMLESPADADPQPAADRVMRALGLTGRG